MRLPFLEIQMTPTQTTETQHGKQWMQWLQSSGTTHVAGVRLGDGSTRCIRCLEPLPQGDYEAGKSVLIAEGPRGAWKALQCKAPPSGRARR